MLSAQRLRPALVSLLVLAPSGAGAQGFTDVSAALGTDTGVRPAPDSVAGGVSMVDLDGDGRLDLLWTALDAPVVFHQRSDGTFARRDDVLVPTGPIEAGGNLPFDMDGDGDLDVLLLGTGADALLRNEGGLVFTDVSRTHLPGLERWSSAAAPADFDGDGDLDVYVTGYIETLEYPRHVCAPDMLLVNDGEGRFTDVAPEIGTDSAGCGLAVVTHDVDDDGDPDVLVVNDFGMFVLPNRVFRNDGPSGPAALSFSERSAELGFDNRLYGMGVAVGDLDADGRDDLVASSIGRPAALLARGGGFADRTRALGADVVFSSDGYQATWGVAVEDFDRDGWADVVMAGGRVIASNFASTGAYQPNVVMRGGPTGLALDPPGWGLAPRGTGRGLAVGDVDADGDPDIAIGQTDGTIALHRNDFPSTAPLRLRLRATETAAAAVGARVTASCDGAIRVAGVVGGGSFAGASDPALRVSFPPPCDVPGRTVDLRVRWPSGYTQTATATTGGALTITEPDWLQAEPGRVVLRPTDANGSPWPAGARVLVRPDGAAPIVASPVPDGSFEATWASGAGPTRVDLEIEGRAWGAHPIVEPPLHRLRVVPGRPVVGAPARAVVSGAPPHAVVRVRHAGETTPLTYDGDGQHTGDLRFDAEGDTVLTLVVDGAEVASSPVHVAGVVDRARSFVRHQSLVQLGAPFLVVRGALRDVNGRPVEVPRSAIALTADGVALTPLTSTSAGGVFEIGLNTSALADDALVQLWVHGAAFGSPARLRRLSSADEVRRHVSPAHSDCAPAMETMRPDGQDVLHFLVFLRDAHGEPLPDLGTAPQLVGDLAPLPEPVVRFDNHYLQRVRATRTPGEATMHVEWYGERVGVSCQVTLEGAPRGTPSELHGTLRARPSELDVATPEQHATLTWEPRDDHRRLMGSGLAGAVWRTTLGVWRSPVEYEGFGRYRRTLGPDRHGGIDAVTVTVGGAVSGATVRIAGPPAPDAGVSPDAGPRVDAGPEIDAGELDAGTPAPDASARRDASPGGEPGTPSGGCGAADGSPSPGPTFIAFSLLLLAARRRRAAPRH